MDQKKDDLIAKGEAERVNREGDAYTCDRRHRSYNILASVYRLGARANQTDIIDLTCDLEIRKIMDGERLEPIIIVNIGRPSSHSFVVATATTAAATAATSGRLSGSLSHPS